MYRCILICSYVFFFKQKTAYEMRISDWSSDVCSSDLAAAEWQPGVMRAAARGLPADQFALANDYAAFFDAVHDRALQWPKTPRRRLIDRKSVVKGKRVYVRVDHGGRRSLKKKKTPQILQHPTHNKLSYNNNNKL